MFSHHFIKHITTIMAIRTRLVFPISPDSNRKFTEFIRVPSHNFTRQITFYVQSQKDGSFNTFIDDTSSKILKDRQLRIKYEVFQKCDYQVSHLQTKGFISFPNRSSVYMDSHELLLFVTIVDERNIEMSEILAVADESNFGLKSVAFQRIKDDKTVSFKHNFNGLTEKMKMTCNTSLDAQNKPRLNYKLHSKKKMSQNGIASFQYARLVSSCVKSKKYNYRFDISHSEPTLDEHLVIISLGTTYNMESRFSVVERLMKVKVKTMITEKISEKIRNIISKAVNILN